MKYKIIVIIFIFIAILGLGYYKIRSAFRPSVKFGDKTLKIELADTPEEWHQGLSKRPSLCADCGMLFIFPSQSFQTFVMRDMNFPLDIIWIKGDKIVKIDENLPPEGSEPKIRYESPGPIDYVLEVNGGFSKNNNVHANDNIQVDLPF